MFLIRAFICAALLALGAGAAAAGELHVYFLDAGQGDAALLVTPGGKAVVIDAGPPGFGRRAAVFLKRRGVRRIDAAVLSHPHPDHAGGFHRLFRVFPVGEVLENGQPYSDPVYDKLVSLMEKKRLPRRALRAGAALDWDPELAVEVLWPPENLLWENPNENSLVLKVTHGRIAFLFPGDVERDAERELAARYGAGLQSDVLKVPHHGGEGSCTTPFLDWARPRLAVVSSRREGLPAESVALGLAALPCALHRTDREGTVHLVSDGKNVWMAPRP